MNTLARVIDDIMHGNGKFTFTAEELDEAIGAQMQHVVRLLVAGSPGLTISITRSLSYSW